MNIIFICAYILLNFMAINLSDPDLQLSSNQNSYLEGIIPDIKFECMALGTAGQKNSCNINMRNISSLVGKLRDENRKCVQIQKQQHKTNEQIKRLEQENIDLKSECDQLRDQNHELQEIITKLKNANQGQLVLQSAQVPSVAIFTLPEIKKRFDETECKVFKMLQLVYEEFKSDGMARIFFTSQIQKWSLISKQKDQLDNLANKICNSTYSSKNPEMNRKLSNNQYDEFNDLKVGDDEVIRKNSSQLSNELDKEQECQSPPRQRPNQSRQFMDQKNLNMNAQSYETRGFQSAASMSRKQSQHDSSILIDNLAGNQIPKFEDPQNFDIDGHIDQIMPYFEKIDIKKIVDKLDSYVSCFQIYPYFVNSDNVLNASDIENKLKSLYKQRIRELLTINFIKQELSSFLNPSQIKILGTISKNLLGQIPIEKSRIHLIENLNLNLLAAEKIEGKGGKQILDAKIKILQLQVDNIYRLIKDEEQFNKRWLETYALIGSTFNDFKDGGRANQENIGKISTRNIAYNDVELKKLATEIYQLIIDSLKSDIPKKKEAQPEVAEDFLDFSAIDHGMLEDGDDFE